MFKKYIEKFKENSFLKIVFDVVLIVLLAVVLVLNFFKTNPFIFWRQFLIFLVLVGIFPVIFSAFRALLNRKLTIDLLAAVALFFAILTGEWISAGFINLMLAFARIFDEIVQLRSKNIIEHLLKFRPERAKVKRGEEIFEIPYEEIKIGDLVVVESGERLAIDGVVVSGQAVINQATLTGESEPITKKEGDKVFSSTLNESGSLLVKAEKVGKDTVLSKIIELTSEASRSKASVESIADKFTGWYIVATLLGSAAIYAVSHNLNLVLAILLVICADDIAVSVPLGFTAGIARAAKRGIIVKGSQVIESVAKIKIFITDKTGTLTTGKPKISEIKTFGKISEQNFLELLGMAEINSHHPNGRAVVNFVQNNKKIKITAPDEFNEVPGEGIIVFKGKNKIVAGKPKFLEAEKVEISAEQKALMKKIQESEKSIIAVGFNKKTIGLAVLEDEVKPGTKAIIEKTRALGVKKWIMLTGDNSAVAKKVSDEVGMDEFHFNLNPQDKLNIVKSFEKRKETLAMIGDGVNDAAALALADVSFAMGAIGSDAAIEAADIALMHDDLKRIPEIMELSKFTMKTVRLNFWIWSITNFVGLVLVFGGFLGPIGASAFNFATDFIPILNSLRILRK